MCRPCCECKGPCLLFSSAEKPVLSALESTGAQFEGCGLGCCLRHRQAGACCCAHLGLAAPLVKLSSVCTSSAYSSYTTKPMLTWLAAPISTVTCPPAYSVTVCGWKPSSCSSSSAAFQEQYRTLNAIFIGTTSCSANTCEHSRLKLEPDQLMLLCPGRVLAGADSC